MNKYYLHLFGKALNKDLDKLDFSKMQDKYIHLANIHNLSKSTISRAIFAYLNNGIVKLSNSNKKQLVRQVNELDCCLNNIYYESIYFRLRHNFLLDKNGGGINMTSEYETKGG